MTRPSNPTQISAAPLASASCPAPAESPDASYLASISILILLTSWDQRKLRGQNVIQVKIDRYLGTGMSELTGPPRTTCTGMSELTGPPRTICTGLGVEGYSHHQLQETWQIWRLFAVSEMRQVPYSPSSQWGGRSPLHHRTVQYFPQLKQQKQRKTKKFGHVS